MAEARVHRERVNSARVKHVQDSVLIRKTVPGNNYRDVVPPTTIQRELNELRARILRTRRPSQRLRDGRHRQPDHVKPSLQRRSRSPFSRRNRSTSTSTCSVEPPSALVRTWRTPELATSHYVEPAAIDEHLRVGVILGQTVEVAGAEEIRTGVADVNDERGPGPRLRAAVRVEPMPRRAASSRPRS